ncbi:MAG TPA: O-antigen ligase family protein [Prolixibacteraceae bacterium]
MMKKQPPKPAKNRTQIVAAPTLRTSYILLLLAYTLIPVFLPNLEAIDSNGPKFLSLSIINLLCFLFLMTTSPQKNEPAPIRLFFSNRIGFAYTLFMAVILLSFTKAINMGEAFITFSMYFSVFAAALNLSVILRSDKRYLRWISIVLAFVLIVDSFTVFYNIPLYITQQIGSIEDIKSVFSNKNILAAAIFIKMVFALWLIIYDNGWVKKAGYFSLCCAFLAILFMSARAFYFGSFLLAVSVVAFILILNYRNKTPQPFKTPGLVLGAFVMALLIFTVTQRYLYPKNGDKYNVSFTQRISQVNKELSDTWRISAWKNSALLFKKDPLLGVGTGNWKIRVLQYENQTKNHAAYMGRNHNDFIQVFTETGLFGGLLFISIFVLIGLNFLVAFFKKEPNEDSIKYLFIPAFGVALCSIDAFFNFPSERPEIQSLFALLVAAGIAYSPLTANFSFLPPQSRIKNQKSKILLTRVLYVSYILILIGSSYVFSLYFKSQKLQMLIESDLAAGAPLHDSSLFLKELPVIPTVSTLGVEPLVVGITRYTMNEGKFRESVDLLLPDKSSPWDSRREFNLAFAFDKLGKKDSALYYARKAVEIKPRFFVNVNVLCNILIENSRKAEAILVLQDYVAKEKYAKEPWLKLSTLYREVGDTIKADNTINEAIKNIPWEKEIILKMAGKR